MGAYEELHEKVISGQQDKVQDMVGVLIDKGNDPLEIMSEGLISPMSVVGQKMKTGEMFIPEVLASAQAMKGGMELLKPLISGEKSSEIYTGKVVIGTVDGDLHNIGKNIVSLMLEGVGFQVVDVGEDIPAEKFVEAVERENPDILGLSALLTTTMSNMKDVIEALKSGNLRDKVKVMVGGAPVTQDFADSIGADGYAPDAGSAADKARQLIGKA